MYIFAFLSTCVAIYQDFYDTAMVAYSTMSDPAAERGGKEMPRGDREVDGGSFFLDSARCWRGIIIRALRELLPNDSQPRLGEPSRLV